MMVNFNDTQLEICNEPVVFFHWDMTLIFPDFSEFREVWEVSSRCLVFSGESHIDLKFKGQALLT